MPEPTDATNQPTDLLETGPAGHELQAAELEAAHVELAPALPMELAAGHPEPGFLRRVYARLPKGQMVRYLFVGMFNTAFGQCCFIAFNWILSHKGVPVSYIFATTLSNLIAINVAFFGYKFIVFRTRGNYWRELLKAHAVYWSGFLPTLLLLPLMVTVFKHLLPAHILLFGFKSDNVHFAPYPANGVLTIIGIVYNFIGHKKVTFAQAKVAPEPVSR